MTNFKTRPDIQKKATQNAHTPEAMKRMLATKSQNILLRNAVLASIKEDLIAAQKTGKQSYYESFIQKFLKAAEDPNSKCGQMLAQTIFTPDVLDRLDEETNSMMAKQLDFTQYRVLKHAFPEQYQYLIDNTSPTIALLCGRRAGKTQSTAMKLVMDAVNPEHHSVYIHRTQTTAIDQCWKHVLELSDEIGMDRSKEDKADGLITYTNGSTIKFFGNSDRTSADKLLGYAFNKAIIDEVQNQINLEYLIYTVLKPTFAGQENPQLIMQGTQPRIPGTFWEAQINNPKIRHYSWTMWQNVYIKDPDALVDGICEEKGVTRDAPFMQREFFNLPAYDTEAQVFKGYLTYKDIPASFKPTKCYIGTDYGFSDKTAVIALECDERDKAHPVAYVVKEMKFNNTGAMDILQQVKNIYEDEKARFLSAGLDPNDIMVITDTNEKAITYDMSKTYHMNAFCAYKYDKQGSIDRLSEYMRTGRLYIPQDGVLDEECRKTIWKRDDNDNIMYGTIDDDAFHPDALDSLRYANVQYDFDCGGTQSKAARPVDAHQATLPPWMQEDSQQC